MEREPSHYSRVVVLAGLLPLLAVDLTVGLPAGGFVGGGAVVLAAAAGIHLYGGEMLAAGGWLVFAVALGVVGAADVTGDVYSLAAVVVLLVSGLLLLASQRMRALDTADDAG